MKKTLYDYCMELGNTALLQQWDVEANAPLSPQCLSFGSHQKAWWRCAKGHQWQAAVKSRAHGAGCPVCANRQVVPGENDLATTHPLLAAEWDGSRNGTLTPQGLLAGSRRKVWWVCAKGHSWQAMVTARAQGAGCPVCAGKVVLPGENDLASRAPDIARQWDLEKNGNLTPETCTAASNRRVWWVCPLGHSYRAAVGARTVNGSDCPYCAGRKVLPGFNDLASCAPEIAASWHPSLNGTLVPEMVTVGSRHKVWWTCPEGHVWKAVVYSRTGAKKCGCPVCAGRHPGPHRRRTALPVGTSQSTAPAVFENIHIGGNQP
ncbi:MAG: zinc-ribbon domain-containing protein [Ruminiclostridium sp.]|nr:zinc-ribbon domain-containing protein [Ruminiclostridium sp.]